ncbi:hypothetical protein, partial [Propionicimonas sp.]|uniref:hypothetical protein n=1 Tax=Propionicimonas sp. TaxID=1955623 RepID=UPI0039E44C5C
ARAAADETAAARLAGRAPDAGAAIAAARRVLDAGGMEGEVRLVGTRVQVSTSTGADTVFLSLIGITRLAAKGSAQADLVSNR